MRILVTGGAGFIGSHVVSLLDERGDAVSVFEREEADASVLPETIGVLRGDVQDAEQLHARMAGFDAVIHCAANAQLWARDASVYEAVNHRGTQNVVRAANASGVSRVVHVSSEAVLAGPRVAVDSRPLNRGGPAARGTAAIEADARIDEAASRSLGEMAGAYSRSKWRAERAVLEHGAIVVVPTVPVGPGDRNRTPPARLIEAFMAGKVPAKVEADLPLVDVRDVATGIVATLDRGKPGKRYLVAGENWTTTRLFAALAEITGRKAPLFNVPYPVALASGYVAQAICRVTGGQPLSTVEGVRLTRKRLRFDDSWSRQQLGLSPRPVMDALRDAVAWLRAYPA